MSTWSLSLGNRQISSCDAHLRECMEMRRVEAVEHDGQCTLTFYHGDFAVAQRTIVDKHLSYALSAAENWCQDILKCDHFTMEERLRA